MAARTHASVRAAASSRLCAAALRRRHCRTHVIVVGGGAVGASTALWLRALAPSRRVTVIERDCSYLHASTPRSVGGVRVQFTCPENVRLSQFGAEFVADAKRTLGEDVGYRPSGYLFLATAAGEASLRRAHAVQTAAGASVELLPPPALAAAYPWLCTDGLALGARGAGEGAFDPHLYLMAARRAATARGAEWLDGTVCRLERGRGCESPDDVRRVVATRPDGSKAVLECSAVVVAAGAWSADVAALDGVDDLPVAPRRRVVFALHSRAAEVGIAGEVPLTVDPFSGAYVKGDGAPGRGRFLAGVSPPASADPDFATSVAPGPELDAALRVTAEDHDGLWEAIVWPAVARLVPQLQDARVVSAWAGFYDYNTHDQNALFGVHPGGARNVVYATGFSGHGIQQAAGAGRAVAELLVHSRYVSIDVSRLAVGRYRRGERIVEEAVV